MADHDWTTVAEQSRDLVKSYASTFAEVLDSSLLAPLTDEFIGQMLSVEIKTPDPEKLYRTFVDEYKIEIPVMRHDDSVYLRYSINGFNTSADLEVLMEAIKDIRGKGELLK